NIDKEYAIECFLKKHLIDLSDSMVNLMYLFSLYVTSAYIPFEILHIIATINEIKNTFFVYMLHLYLKTHNNFLKPINKTTLPVSTTIFPYSLFYGFFGRSFSFKNPISEFYTYL